VFSNPPRFCAAEGFIKKGTPFFYSSFLPPRFGGFSHPKRGFRPEKYWRKEGFSFFCALLKKNLGNRGIKNYEDVFFKPPL